MKEYKNNLAYKYTLVKKNLNKLNNTVLNNGYNFMLHLAFKNEYY